MKYVENMILKIILLIRMDLLILMIVLVYLMKD